MADTRFKRFVFSAAAVAAMSFAGVSFAAEPSAADSAGPAASGGVVGVCVRWGADDHHVADAVVVEPSGDAALDTTVPNTLRAMDWEKPEGYAGEWLGLSVGVDGAKPKAVLPSCDGLGGLVAGKPLVTERAIRT
jgi:hypothetical protein